MLHIMTPPITLAGSFEGENMFWNVRRGSFAEVHTCAFSFPKILQGFLYLACKILFIYFDGKSAKMSAGLTDIADFQTLANFETA